MEKHYCMEKPLLFCISYVVKHIHQMLESHQQGWREVGNTHFPLKSITGAFALSKRTFFIDSSVIFNLG